MADELKAGIPYYLINCGSLSSSPSSRYPVKPFYRLFNPSTHDHLYTDNDGERLTCVNNNWNYEGIAALIPSNGSDATGAPLYRISHPQGIAHVYTLNAKERDNLINHGWRFEGTYFGASKWPSAQQVPMYGARSDGLTTYTDMVWTTSREEWQSLRNRSWGDGGTWITGQTHLVADIQNNSNTNGAKIQVWPGNNSDAQIWTLTPPSGALNGGWIIQKRISNKVLSRGAYHSHYYDIILQDKSIGTMYWDIVPIPNKKFYFGETAYPAYYIRNNNHYLEVMTGNDGIPRAGAQLTACRSAGLPTQSDNMWLIVPTNLNSGVYSIHPLVNDAQKTHRMDVEGPGVSNVKIWSQSTSQGQLWVPIKRPGTDMFAIRNLSNAGYLDVPGGKSNVASGVNVQVYPNYDGATEDWHVVGFGRTLVNGKDAEMYRLGMFGPGNKEYVLDVSGGSTSIGANVQVYEMNGTDAQLFAFVPHDVNDPTVPVPSKIGLSKQQGIFANQTYQRVPYDYENGLPCGFPCWVCTDAWFGDIGVGANTANENGYEVRYRQRFYDNKTNNWGAWGPWIGWETTNVRKDGNNATTWASNQYVKKYNRKDYRNEQVQWQVRCVGTSTDYTGSVHGAPAEAMLYFIQAPLYTFGTNTVEQEIACIPGVVEYALRDTLNTLISIDMYQISDDVVYSIYDALPEYKIENNKIIFENQKATFVGDGITTDFDLMFGASSVVNVTYGSVSDIFDNAETETGYSYTLNYTATEVESVIVNSVNTLPEEAYHLNTNQMVIDGWPVTEHCITLVGSMSHPTETEPVDRKDYFIQDDNGEYICVWSNTLRRYSKVANPTKEDIATYYVFASMSFEQEYPLDFTLSYPVSVDVYDVRSNARQYTEGEDYEIVHQGNSYILHLYSAQSYQDIFITYYTNECHTENTSLAVTYSTNYSVTPTIDPTDNKKLIFATPIPNSMIADIEFVFEPEDNAIINVRYIADDLAAAAITLDGLAVPYTNDLDGSSNIYIMEMSITKNGKSHKVLNMEQAITSLGRNGIFTVKFNDFINYLDGESVTFKYQVGNDQHSRWTDITSTATLELDTSAGTLDIWPVTGPMTEQGPRHTGVIFMPKDTNLRCGMAYKDNVFELPRWEEFDKTVNGVEYSAFALPYSFRDESTRIVGQRSNANGDFGIESAEIDLRIFDQEKVHSWITTDGDIVCIDCREGDYLQSDRSMQKNNTALDLSGREHQTVIFGDTNQSSFTVEGSIIYSEDYRNTDSTLEDIDALLGTHTIYRDPYGHVVYAAVTDVSYQTHHDYATVSISMIEETR